MNRIIISIITIIIVGGCGGATKRQTATDGNGDGLSGSIQLSGAFALYPMVIKWSEEFRKLHPNVQIDVSGGGAGKGMTDALAGVADMGMVSREIYAEEIAKGAFPVAVVKDAVVPVINDRNPELAAIKKRGLSRETARKLWNKEITHWGEITGSQDGLPLHVFTRSDACGAAETFAAWFGRKQEHLRATAVFGDPGIAVAVQKDKAGIGYNNIAYAYDQKTKKTFEGLTVIPLDLNDNGVIEPEEDFYESVETLMKAIDEGRFPSPPARDLYLVTRGRPQRPEVIAFLAYVLNEGQQYAAETGFIALPEEKRKAEADKLY
ncbi:MAG: substrate-binding domain-containing protein [Tannerella sp.]|jgi:phosphate transport system substrate-binding protein|nr:substrate-binding domain-containing protein [Tannerella sp.]